MITSQGRYEPSAGARISLWPTQSIDVSAADQSDGLCSLRLDLGGTVVHLFDQDAAALEVLGHALIRLAEEQRRGVARKDLEPLQEK